MTTTVEQPTREERRGTRLEQLERAHAKRVAELDGLQREIAELRVAEDEALRKSVREKPTVRAYILGSDSLRLRERREKAEKKIEPLEREVNELAPLLAEERSRRALEELEAKLDDGKTLRARERAGWEHLGELFAEFARVWREEVVAPAETLDRLHDEIERTGLLPLVDEEFRARLERELRPVVRPFPVTLGTVLERLFLAAADPGRRGFHGLGDHDIWLDNERVLARVTPDLRELPAAALSGRIETVRGRDFR